MTHPMLGPFHASSGTGGPVVDALMTKGPMGMGVDATCFHGCKPLFFG